MKLAIPYYRVSTEQQGVSGLGLAAQQKAVHDFAKANNITLIMEFIEVESGTKAKRPILSDALDHCRKQKAMLLIAKLDRLGRNVSFISKLMESQVAFIAVDNPYANKLIVHIMAAFAEHERDQISMRTKLALAAARRRGTILGRYGRDVLSRQNREDANRFAMTMQPVIRDLRRIGINSVRGIAEALNCRKVPTYRGSQYRWHPTSVHALLLRLDQLSTRIKQL